ncbi:ATP-binding protein [Desulfospira joergensenii]|uniref:ATP-binding protein n=1 Tax=Desulfospira joergensenii TaxID=53329 RepID=UPI0003B614DB|nr:ATP-binding protein [Desulfospira joergensenii]
MKLGLRGKIYLGFFFLLLVQGLVIFAWISHVMKESMLDEIKNRGASIGNSLSVGLVEPMLAMDFLRMKVLVDETVRLDQDIFYTFVLDREGNPLVHTFKNGFPVQLKAANQVSDRGTASLQLLDTGDQRVYDYAVPVKVNGDSLGTLRLGLFQSRAEKVVNQILVSTIIIIVLAIFTAGFVGALLVNPMTRSIKKLHDSSEQALRGNLDVHTAPMLGKNCWDIMLCHRQECPAYKNYHHRCWYLAGTLCPTCIEGEYAKKIESCRQCQVYKQCSGDEIQSLAESFDAMTLSLKGNLSVLKKAEKILSDQKIRLQTILDAIPDFISLQDQEGRFVSVNRTFCEMLGKTKDEIVGRVNADLFPPSHAERYNEEDRKVLETGIPLIKENQVTGPKGSKWLHVVKICVSETEERSKGLVCSGRDITPLKRVQEQLTHAQKMESVGRLAAGVAHEINTPLGIILGYGQLLLEDVEKEGQIHGDLISIVKQTKICARIVKDLLNFSRSGDRVISRFDVNEALEEVVSMVDHTFSLNHVNISRQYHGRPLIMNGDPEKIKQVFINLLHNSFDAIGEDGQIHVTTREAKAGKEIEISITDTGCGIGREEIQKIFEPFYTTKGPDQGTGLGLSVSFGIIKEHNGRIKAHSPPISDKTLAQGTQFIVSLPLGSNRMEGA